MQSSKGCRRVYIGRLPPAGSSWAISIAQDPLASCRITMWPHHCDCCYKLWKRDFSCDYKCKYKLMVTVSSLSVRHCCSLWCRLERSGDTPGPTASSRLGPQLFQAAASHLSDENHSQSPSLSSTNISNVSAKHALFSSCDGNSTRCPYWAFRIRYSIYTENASVGGVWHKQAVTTPDFSVGFVPREWHRKRKEEA